MQHAQRAATSGGNKGVASRNIISGGAAAKALGIHRSTLTRYLKSHPELNRSTRDDEILVDLDELRKHRDENVNRMKSGNHAGRLYDEPPPLLPREAESEGTGEDEDAECDTGASLQDETVAKLRARRERIMLNRLEREEAVQTGELTPAAEVEEAAGEALVQLRDALMSPDLDLCEKLAATKEAGEVAAILREANRKALEKLSEDFENDAERGGPA